MDKRVKTLLYTGLAFIFVGVYLLQHPIPFSPQDKMVRLINQERGRVGVLGVRENGYLDESAHNKACDLRDRNYWAHYAPDGTSPWDFIHETGYNYYYAGENLCKDNNVEVCMENFMQSPAHRANILDSDYRDVGIGICGNFVVQHFGSGNY
jgi:uncharacterized protein YkwD